MSTLTRPNRGGSPGRRSQCFGFMRWNDHWLLTKKIRQSFAPMSNAPLNGAVFSKASECRSECAFSDRATSTGFEAHRSQVRSLTSDRIKQVGPPVLFKNPRSRSCRTRPRAVLRIGMVFLDVQEADGRLEAAYDWQAMTNLRLAWIAVAVVALAPGMAAQDWTQWRGPNRDGVMASFREPASWPAALTKRWRVEVGTGYATPLVVGNRVYSFTRQGDEEVVTALEASSGKVLWRTAYPAAFKMNPATAPHGPGPKSTPTLAGNRLFTLGISGIVTAFDAETGRQIWQKPAGPVEPLFHTGMSPLVDGNLVIFHVGGHDAGALTAFDVATGDVRWSWKGDGPAYGSPLVFELSGTRQVVTFTQQNFVGVSLATGQLLWRRPYTTAVHDDQPDPHPLQGHGDRDGTRQRRDRVPGGAARRRMGDRERLAHRRGLDAHERCGGDRRRAVRLVASEPGPVLRPRSGHRHRCSGRASRARRTTPPSSEPARRSSRSKTTASW